MRQRIMKELDAPEVKSTRARANSGAVGRVDFEEWVVRALYLIARVGDRAYDSGNTFTDALEDALRSDDCENSRSIGKTRRVDGTFTPHKDKEGQALTRTYASHIGRHLNMTIASLGHEAGLALHPTFIWRAFDGSAQTSATSRARLENLMAVFAILGDINASSQARSLVLLNKLSMNCKGYQRRIVYQLLGGERGVVGGALFTPDNAKKFFGAQLSTTNIPSQYLIRPIGTVGSIRFPQQVGLAECWGYMTEAARSINELASIVFPGVDKTEQMRLMSQLMTYDRRRSLTRPRGTSMPATKVQKISRELNVHITDAWNLLFQDNVTGARQALIAAAGLRPDLFNPTALLSLGVNKAPTPSESTLVEYDSQDFSL